MVGASPKTSLVRKVSMLVPLLSAVNLRNYDTEACCKAVIVMFFTNSTMFENRLKCLIIVIISITQ